MKYYPSYIYSANEQITRQNMKRYDQEEAAAQIEIDQTAAALGRSLNIRERCEILDRHHNR